jgi:hypothetical protein
VGSIRTEKHMEDTNIETPEFWVGTELVNRIIYLRTSTKKNVVILILIVTRMYKDEATSQKNSFVLIELILGA